MACLVDPGAAECRGRAAHPGGVVVGMKLGLSVVLEQKVVAAASVTEDHPWDS